MGRSKSRDPVFQACFSAMVSEFRGLQGLMQQQLADRMGVPVSLISHYETGSRLPDIQIWFGCRMRWMSRWMRF